MFKDVLNLQKLRKPEILGNLLKLLAFQVGGEVSYTELSKKLGIDHATAQYFIYLLEESFIIFRLQALKRNLRNEVVKSRKVYFWDLGIRNSIIQNYNTLEFRDDIGKLWENFCVAERLKFKTNKRDHFNTYFWRTYQQKEIDYLEESGGAFKAFGFKFSTGKKPKIPNDFNQAYERTEFHVIDQENFMQELFTN